MSEVAAIGRPSEVAGFALAGALIGATVACALPAVALTPVGAVGAAAKTGFTAASTGAQRSIKIRVKVCRVIVGLGFSLIEYLQKLH